MKYVDLSVVEGDVCFLSFLLGRHTDGAAIPGEFACTFGSAEWCQACERVSDLLCAATHRVLGFIL